MGAPAAAVALWLLVILPVPEYILANLLKNSLSTDLSEFSLNNTVILVPLLLLILLYIVVCMYMGDIFFPPY